MQGVEGGDGSHHITGGVGSVTSKEVCTVSIWVAEGRGGVKEVGLSRWLGWYGF